MNATYKDWKIGISSWIIQDGNYDDFHVGQRAEFALEFYSQSYQKSSVRLKSAKHLSGSKYEICGEVIFLTSGVWVLDFGICAFQESKPPDEITVGSFVAAEIFLGIDPFFYFESLHSMPSMPPLIYSWAVNGIAQQTAPFVETQESSGSKILTRDEQKFGYKPIIETDAWKDDGGNAEYLLTCSHLDIPPQFKSSTTT